MSKKPPSRERAASLPLAQKFKVVAVPALRPEPRTEPSPSPPVPVCDPGPPPITTLFGIGRPNVPPPSRKDGKRRSGDYLLGAQRIEAEVATRPGDYLNGADIRLAEGWMRTAEGLERIAERTGSMGTIQQSRRRPAGTHGSRFGSFAACWRSGCRSPPVQNRRRPYVDSGRPRSLIG
jgi:hypothetical protein